MTRSPRRAAVVGAMAAAVLLPGCALDLDAARTLPAAVPGPPAPYGHAPQGETSVAGPVSTGGDLERLAAALTAAGFFCAHVRANEAAVQVWCRSAEEHVPDVGALGPDVTVVDLVGTPDGALEYGHVTLPYVGDAFQATDRSQPDRQRAALDASFLSVWPEDADAVRSVVADVAQPPLGISTSRSDSRPAERRAARTAHATYTVAERDPQQQSGDVHAYPALELTVTTAALADRNWPLGSASYARAVTEVPALSADTRRCEDPRRACVHQPVAGVTPVGEGAAGEALPALTDDVRTAVVVQLERCRLTGNSFTGVVGGAVLTVDAHRGRPGANGTFSVGFDAAVGAPLVARPAGGGGRPGGPRAGGGRGRGRAGERL